MSPYPSIVNLLSFYLPSRTPIEHAYSLAFSTSIGTAIYASWCCHFVIQGTAAVEPILAEVEPSQSVLT
jgi:hypothetical protein